MSVDHGDLAVKAEAPFLHVRPGHFVIVAGDQLDQGDWWMGQVLFCEEVLATPGFRRCFRWLTWIRASSNGSMPMRSRM